MVPVCHKGTVIFELYTIYEQTLLQSHHGPWFCVNGRGWTDIKVIRESLQSAVLKL